eukprot:3470264-Pyramimonas_sp.AAC.1
MRFYRLGGIFVEQTRGIPIGGPLSGGILNVVLSDKETQYDRKNPNRVSQMACGRYVDDLVCLSYVLCRCCLKRKLPQIYQGVVFFKVDEDFSTLPDGTIIQKFLDVELHFRFQVLRLNPVHKNEQFAWSGNPAHLVKKSIPPYTHSQDPRVLRAHRAELRGRVCRWEQIGVPNSILAYLMLTDMMVYLHLHYPGLSLSFLIQALDWAISALTA